MEISPTFTHSVSVFTFSEISYFPQIHLDYVRKIVFARFYLQVMEEERINTGKSTEMELKVLSDLNYGFTRSLSTPGPDFSDNIKLAVHFDQSWHFQVLAHNNLIGRIIGKSGATIKKIMEDTDTKITVSSISDISSFNPERVITIKGAIPDISRAEAEVN